MKNKQIFFTSDWHIGHENSIKFDNRPFKDLQDMHTQLVKNFNKQVPNDGITYFLGDMVTHGSDITKSVISQLNGIKVLIVGNHDKNYQSCYNSGFDVVLNKATIKIGQNEVTLTHCPLRGVYRENTEGMKGVIQIENWHGESRHNQFSVEDEGQFHLHGHIHSPNSGKSQKILGKQFDVGLPANNYRPVHISIIESWIDKTKNNK